MDSQAPRPSTTPLGRPLGKKSADAFFGIGVEHVFDHDPGRMFVGISEAHSELGVERLFADANDMRRLRRDAPRQAHCLGPLLSGWYHAIDKPDAAGLAGPKPVPSHAPLPPPLA